MTEREQLVELKQLVARFAAKCTEQQQLIAELTAECERLRLEAHRDVL